MNISNNNYNNGNYDIISTFCNNNDYNSKIIKIDWLIFNFALEFAVNALFFNVLYQLPQILYSSIISDAFNYILRMLALSQDNILDFKGQKGNIHLDKTVKLLNSKVKIKFIFYFIFSNIFLIFFWYYISMFCAIYVNTQIHLTKDTLLSFAISLIYPFIFSILPGICGIPSLSKNNRKILYIISRLFQMI